MKTKLFSLLVALIATMSVFAYDFKYGDLYYNIKDDGTAEVTYQKLYSSENYSGLTSVVIPQSVTYNGTTYRVTSIGNYAFEGCSSLTSVTIPDDVTRIGGQAFSSTPWYDNQPDGVVYIGRVLYKYKGIMPQGTNIVVKEGTTSISGGAFSTPFDDCRGLISITIPNSVTDIGKHAFSGTSWYDNQPDGVVYVGKVVYEYKGTVPQGTNIVIKEGTISISSEAFYWCGDGNVSITIPNSVINIGCDAFWKVANIIYSGEATGSPWGARCMNGYVDGCLVYENASKTNLLACSHSAAGDIIIPNSVVNIGEHTFHKCTDITSITIPNSVANIGACAFLYCSGLISVTLPNSITNLGEHAFDNCSGLKSVTIGNGITSIKERAFFDCRNLTSVTIGNSVTDIESEAFCGCRSLTFVTIPDNIINIGGGAFSYCSGLTSVTIPNSVADIGVEAFEGCSNLETVTFGSELQNIGDNAFKGCQNIYEMTVYATQVPNVVAEKEGSTDYGTFQGVSKLAELHVPAESVKKYKIHPVWGLFNIVTNTNIPYVVTLSCDSVQGSVEGSGSYQPNEQITITAKPNTGYRFVQWSDGNTENPRTIVVTSDTTLTAEFEEIPASEYTVSVVVDPTQHGTVQMTLMAVPDEGYQFARWSDGNMENPRTILVTENMTLSATFVLSGITTEYSNASAEEPKADTRKVFRNGQVYIIRGEKTYTATGSQL